MTTNDSALEKPREHAASPSLDEFIEQFGPTKGTELANLQIALELGVLSASEVLRRRRKLLTS
jgi:hypothetical protein